jgi:adenylate cyclase class 2
LDSRFIDSLEIEVKFFIEDIASMREKLFALEAIHKGRVFEKNLRLDTTDGRLLEKASLLRLRQAGNATLTFKSKPSVEDSEFKTLTEYEVEVGSFDAMKIILGALGFHPVQVYEKWRETFVLGDTQILIDAMPYGNFMELEGSRTGIPDLAETLGMDWNHRILLNYLAMFEIIRKQMGLGFNDVTFDNFSGLHIRMADFLPHFYPKGTV